MATAPVNTPAQTPTQVADQLYREVYGQLVASLVSFFGLPNIELAQDLAQETFLAALQHWPHTMPDNPKAWLFRVCKNKALNHLQQQSGRQELLNTSGYVQDANHQRYTLSRLFLDHEIQDNQLRLLFALCHPSLQPKAQVVLTLRIMAGFKVPEIARGLGMTVEAVKKTLVRARKAIKEQGRPLKVPYLMQSVQRLQQVHAVLYLMFNEGYSASNGNEVIRAELCYEAMRLTKALLALQQLATTETQALFALMLLNMARFEARTDASGALIGLEHQNRQLWHQPSIQTAYHYLQQARSGNRLSRYHIEAAIASIHCAAPTFAATDWCAIVKLYNQLLKFQPSAYVQLNRCIALAQCQGPEVAINNLQHAPWAASLQNYYLYHSTLGKLYQQCGQLQAARAAFATAATLTNLPAEQHYLEQLIQHTIAHKP